MTKKRTRAVGLAATLVSIPLLLPSAAGANAGHGYVGSSSDPDSYPPLPGTCAGGQLWWQWTGDPNAKALSDTSPYIILNLQVPAGHVSIPEAITWDARKVIDDHEGDDGENDDEPIVEIASAEQLQSNQNDQGENEDNEVNEEADNPQLPAPELNESLRVEFYNGTDLIAASPFFTPDLLDDNPYAWSVSDLGTVDLPVDATKVVLAHSSTFMQTDGTPNRFLPKAVCIKSMPFVKDAAVSLTHDCDNATLTMNNNGEVRSEFSYGVDNDWTTLSLGPGESKVVTIPLVEDQSTYVEARADGNKVVAETITPNCVVPPTTTTPPTTTPPQTVVTQPEVEVLPQTQTQTAAPALAFTGSETVRNTGIGAAFLAVGAALLAVGRRRKES